MRAERWAYENMRPGEFRCSRCEKWKSDDDMHPFSSDPYGPPICGDCLDELLSAKDAKEKEDEQ